MADQQRFGPDNWISAYGEPLSENFRLRRDIAAGLSAIGERLIRAEIDDASLRGVLDAVKALDAALPLAPVLEHAGVGARLVRGEAGVDDVLMNFDFDAATGLSNPAAPNLVFVDHSAIAPDGTPSMVEARVTLGALHGGGPGNAHGGILAAMLDVVLARVQYKAGFMGVTGYLNLRYLHPTPLHRELSVRAWPVSPVGRATRICGGVWLDGEQTVEAEGLFVARRRPGGS